MSRSSKFLGVPVSWQFPTWHAIGKNMWNKSRDAAMFPPKVWGYGWSFNFAYPRIKSKPLWKRVVAFVIGVVLLIGVLYALVCIVMLILLWLFPPQDVITITLG